MRVTQQLKYALYGVFDLAYHGGKRPIPIHEIGDRQGIPARYLEQIFQKLRRAGLIDSKRGPRGGYVLARPAEAITLADVLRAVEGEVLRTPDREGSEHAQSPVFVWGQVRDGVRRALGEQTLADLCVEAARRGIPRAEGDPAMYHI
jgi:Rrf2 family protein